jgi:hypothetical protein
VTDERLSAYLDGELTPTDVASLEADLVASPELATDLASLDRTRQLLRSMGDVEPTPGVFDPVVVSLDAKRRGRRARRLAAPAVAVLGVAAVWLLVLGVFSGTGVARLVPAVDDYVDRHASAIELVESDGFLAIDTADMPPMVDDDTGLAMMGAYRRDDVMQAVYSDGTHELSVYREPGRVDWDSIEARGGTVDEVDDDKMWHYEADGFAVVVVERRDHVVTVVADPGMDDMMMKAADI